MTLYDLYIPVLVFAVVGLTFPCINLFFSSIVRRSHPTPEKLTTYECGEVPFGEAWHQFSIQYYMYGILLVIFDVEMIFLLLWAVLYRSLGMLPFLGMLLFIGLIVVGFAYEWKKGVLSWL